MKIKNYLYCVDATNSTHRVLSDDEKRCIIEYYKSHVFMGGEFIDKNQLNDYTPDKIAKFKHEDDLKAIEKMRIIRKWNIVKERHIQCLDIGCGHGSFIKQWISQGYGMGVGIELSAASISISDVKDLITELDVNNIEEYSIPSDTSFIVAFDVIEHLFDMDCFFSALYKKITKNTLFVFEIPIISENLNIHDLENGYPYLYPTRHLHLYTQRGIEELVKSHGFVIQVYSIRKNGNKYIAGISKI